MHTGCAKEILKAKGESLKHPLPKTLRQDRTSSRGERVKENRGVAKSTVES